jgi:hypothetical protein
MPKMGLAPPAGNGGAHHTQAVVGGFYDIFFCDGRPKTGPARSGLEFCSRTEKRGVAANAPKDAFVMHVQIVSGERPFRSGMAGNFER